MLKQIFWIIVCLFTIYSLNLGQSKPKETKVINVGVLNEKAKTLPMPKVPPIQPRIAGSVNILIKIDLQKGEVISANAISGHALLRLPAEQAAKQAKFEPILEEFDTVYALGVLVYKIENLNGEAIENKHPKPILSIVDSRKAIINGRAINLEKPEYPEEAKNSCANGKVEVLTLIHSWKGEVVAAKAISGNELLFRASEKAVMKSKFASSNFSGDNDFYVLGKVVYNFDSLSKCINVGVVNKRALSLPKPQANLSHFRINEEQIVVVQVIIDENGKVISADAIFGHALLRGACEHAARQTKFPSTLINPGPLKISALLVYKFKPDRTIDTNIEKDDESVLGRAVNLISPPFVSCNCRFPSNPNVLVQAEVDEQGNVTKATGISGHSVLKQASEQAVRSSKFLPINLKTKLIISYNFTEVDKWSVKFSRVEIKNVRLLN